jgi:hypothetical protein
VLSRIAKTDANGEFRFADVPPGSGYQLVATGEDFRATAHGQRTWDDPWIPIRLKPGENLRDISISVSPYTSIRGRVLDNRGRPISNARVIALIRDYVQGRRVLREATSTISAPTGNYSLSGLSPGVYYVRVMPAHRDPNANTVLTAPAQADRPSRGRPIILSDEPEGYPLTYFPNTSVIETATAIRLPGGGVAKDIDVILSQVRTARVRGSVKNEAAAVMEGQLIMQRRGAALESSWTRTAEIREGRFDIHGVLPGSYIVWARAGEDGNPLWSRTTLDVRDNDDKTIDLQVVPAPDISGQIRVEGWMDSTPPDFSLFSIHLVADTLSPVDIDLPSPQLAITSKSAVSSSDGKFKLTGVPPMDYRVLVSAQSGDPARGPVAFRNVYTKSVQLANRDVSNDGLEVTIPFDGALEVVVALDGGGLDGRVLNENRESAGPAAVVLVPDARQRKDLYFAVRASNTGRFQFQGIPPGTYKLFAWKEAPLGAWYDPDFLRDYEARGTPLRVEPGQAEYVEVQWLR